MRTQIVVANPIAISTSPEIMMAFFITSQIYSLAASNSMRFRLFYLFIYNHSMWWLYALLSAVFAAATAILAKIGVSGINSNLATAVRTTVILIFAWGIVMFQGTTGQLRLLPQKTLVFLVLSGIATGLSWLFYFRALQLGPASRVAPVDKLSLVFTIFLAWFLLHEKVSLPVILGTLLMLSGTLLITFAK
jgi:transporter family protein